MGERSYDTGRLVAVAASLACCACGVGAVLAQVEPPVRAALAGGALAGAVAAAWGLVASALRAARLRHAATARQIAILAERLLRLERAEARPAPRDDGLAGDVEALSRIVRDLADAVASGERDGPRAMPPPAEPSARAPAADFPPALVADLRRAPPPPAAARFAETPAGSVLQAVAAGRVEVFLDPIVTLPQRRTMRHDLVPWLRLADDSLAPITEALPLIERAGLLPRLDEAILDRALRLSGAGASGPLVVPLSGAALREPAALAALELGLSRRGAGPGLAVAVPQAAWAGFGEREAGALARLRSHGIDLAVSQVTEPDIAWEALAGHGVVLAKVAAARLLALEGADRLSGALARLGIALVADEVADPGLVPDLLDLDVPLAQGPAFGRPRRPAALDGPAAFDPPASEPGREAGALTFRDTLRRAG